MSTLQIINLAWTIALAILYVYLARKLHKAFPHESTAFQVIFVIAVFAGAGAGIYLTEALVSSVEVRGFVFPIWYCLPITYAGYFFDFGRRK